MVSGEYCPFCAGREERTPPQTLVLTHTHPDHVYGLPALVQRASSRGTAA